MAEVKYPVKVSPLQRQVHDVIREAEGIPISGSKILDKLEKKMPIQMVQQPH